MQEVISEPQDVSDAELDTLVKDNEWVLIDFWAPWCGPCQMVAPILKEVAKERAGELVIAKVNTDVHQQNAGRFNVRGIPTMVLMHNGAPAAIQVGAMPKPMLTHWLEHQMDPNHSH